MSSPSSLVAPSMLSRRLVARRACLLCREKKIKCDGEFLRSGRDVVPETQAEGQDNDRPNSQNTQVICSNCKFLGIECVFVRSNRGGRRKKRTALESPLGDLKHPKVFKPDGSIVLPDLLTSLENSDKQDRPVQLLPHMPIQHSIGIGSISNNSTTSEQVNAGEKSNETPSIPSTLRLGSASAETASLNQSQVPSVFRFDKGPRPTSPTLSFESSAYHFRDRDLRRERQLSDYSSLYDFPYDTRKPHRSRHGPPSHDGRGPPHLPHMEDFYPRMTNYFSPHPFHGHKHHRKKLHHLMAGGYFPSFPPPFPPPPLPHGFGPPGPPLGGPPEHHHHYNHYHPGPLGHPEHPGHPGHPSHPGHPGNQAFNELLGPGSRNLDHRGRSQTGGSSNGSAELESDFHTRHAGHVGLQALPPPNGYYRPKSGESTVLPPLNQRSLKGIEVLDIPDPSVPETSLNGSRVDEIKLNSPHSSRHLGYGMHVEESDSAYPPLPPFYHLRERNHHRHHGDVDYHKNGVHRHVISTKEIFTEQTLAEIPDSKTLHAVLDIYYLYNHPDHQLLPKKATLLKHFSVSSCPAVYYAIFATIARINTLVLKEEQFWLELSMEHWDELNTIELFLTYILVLKSSTYMNNFKRGHDLNLRIWSLIKRENILETCKQKLKEEYREMFANSTNRQLYDREMMVRLLWDYWVNRVVIFRIRMGHPYKKLTQYEPSDDSEFEMDHYLDKIELPIDNETYFKDIRNLDLDSRLLWLDLNQEFSSDNPKPLTDINMFLMAIIHTNNSVEAISRNGMFKSNLTRLRTVGEKLPRCSLQNLFRFEGDKGMINATYLISHMICKCTKMVCHLEFLKEVIVFRILDSVGDETSASDSLPLMRRISAVSLPDFDELQLKLGVMTPMQLGCLINVISSALDTIKLIELGEGLIPENYTDLENITAGPIQTACKISIGVTGNGSVDKRWYEDPIEGADLEKVSDLPNTWMQYPTFSQNIVSTVFVAMASLFVLAKYIRFEENDSTSVRAIITTNQKETSERVELSPQIVPVDNHITVKQLTSEFKLNFLLQKLTTCSNFMRLRARFNDEPAKESSQNIDKIIHYLEEFMLKN